MSAAPAGAEVFISYSRRASAAPARALAQALGPRAFFDETDVDTGDQIPSGIVDGLVKARVVVVFAERTYFRRWYCLRELDVAFAAFNALMERGGTTAERVEALAPVVVAVGADPGEDFDRFPSWLRTTNWCSAADTFAVVALIDKRLGTVARSIGDRLAALGELDSVRTTVLETAAIPSARSLAGVPRFDLPGELRPSIGDAFVGRADDLWRIHHQLSTLRGDGTAAALTGALEGGGGFGKTRLATEYVHRFGPGYRGGIFWVNAEFEERRDEQLHGVLATLAPGTPPLPSMREAGRDVARELGTVLSARVGPPALYVVDNVPEPETGAPPRALTTWCPAIGHVALLVTSRAHQSVTAGVRSLPVDTLAPEPAVTMLTRDLPPQPYLDPGAWPRIAGWVGYLPLALELLNASLREGVFEVAELAALVEVHDPLATLDEGALALRGVVPASTLRGISEALAASYDNLPPPAQVAARLLAQLAPAPIPVAILEALGPQASDRSVRATLVARSFVTRPAEGSSIAVFGTMHRVLAGFLRARSPDQDADLAAACEGLLSLMTAETCQDPGRWASLMACVPHAETLLTRVRARPPGLATGAGWQLGIHLGLLLWSQGLAHRARAIEEAALELARDTGGSDHPHTLISANNLAATLRALGDTAGARGLYEEVLGGHLRVFGPEHPETLNSANNLAETLRAQGDAAGARGMHKEVLEARRRVLGSEHPETLNSANNLAAALLGLGDAAGAEYLLREVLEVRRRILGPEHRDTLGSANNLAAALRDLGDASGARGMIEEALDVCRRVLGPEHPATLISASNLASTLQDLGDAAGARHLTEEVLDAQRRLLGPKHPDTTTSAWNLLVICQSLQDRMGSRDVFERDLAWLLTADPSRLDADQRMVLGSLRPPDDPA